MNESQIQNNKIPQPQVDTSQALGCLFIFVVALLLRLWFNFAAEHINCFDACDASEYLRNAQALLNLGQYGSTLWQEGLSCLLGTASQATIAHTKNAFAVLREMHQSAPVFPLFILSSYFLSGTAFNAANSTPPLLAQSILSAAACVLITLTGSYAWDRRIGFVAGLIAAFYPAFIVNSGRLYSESFSTFWICLLLWLIVRGFHKSNSSWLIVLIGMTAAALQLTRSIMCLATIAIFPITFFQKRNIGKGGSWTAIFLLIIGLALVMAPWLAVQKLAFGNSKLIVDRVGHYNLFIGNNVDTFGWLSYPYPDGSGIEKKSFSQLIQEGIKRSPSRWLKLMLDKPVRLLKFPWNDFRTQIGPFTMAKQVLFHQLLLLLSAIGLILGLAVNTGSKFPTKPQLQSRFFLLGLLLLHGIYLLFITVPRYNLTAMPVIILFAATGIVSIIRLAIAAKFTIKNHQFLSVLGLLISATMLFITARFNLSSVFISPILIGITKTIFLAFFVFALFKTTALLNGHRNWAKWSAPIIGILLFPFLCLPLRAHGRYNTEWECLLDRTGQSIVQQINLNPEQAAQVTNHLCYLLIDCRGAQALKNGSKIEINGHVIKNSPLIPGLALIQDLTSYKYHNPQTLYLECEYIFDALCRSANTNNADLRQWFLLPIPSDYLTSLISTQKIVITITKTDNSSVILFGSRQLDGHSERTIPHTGLYSWEKAFYGVENDQELNDPRYDMKLRNAGEITSSGNQTNAGGIYNIYLLCSTNGVAKEKKEPLLHMDLPAGNTEPNNKLIQTISIPNIDQCLSNDIWIVTLSGKAVQIQKSNQKSKLSIELFIKLLNPKSQSLTYAPPWLPRNFTVGTDCIPFSYSFPMAPATLPGKLSKIDTEFLSTQPVELKDLQIEIHKLPSNALLTSHHIY